MAIVKELKNLGKKMTGADLAGNTVSEALKAIEEKYTGGGTHEPTYETVAEIQVGDPVEDAEGVPEGCVAYMVADTAAAKAIMASSEDSLYFNNAETPLTRLTNEMAVFGYNLEMGDTPVVTGKPAYLVTAANEGKTDAIVEIMSTEDLSGQTVKILKQVDQTEPSGAGKFVVNFTVDEATEDTSSDKEPSAILAAQKADKIVVGRIQFGTFVVEAPLVEYGDSRLAFSVVSQKVSYNVIWDGKSWTPSVYQLADT